MKQIEHFDAPWEAALSCLAIHLIESRQMATAEWTQALSESARRGDSYYTACLNALEQVALRKAWILDGELERALQAPHVHEHSHYER